MARHGTSPAPEEDPEYASEEEVETETVDSTAPQISGVTGWTDGDSFTLQWTTNEASSSYVEFEGYGTYGDPELTTLHTLRFQAQQGMSLTFSLVSTDGSGNTAEDGPWQISI